MDDPKQHVIDTLKEANNILVTVRTGPSVDQLAACIALTLVLNDLGKHGTAVFSGQVPSVLEFLEPEKTLEKNTDSLQDFIISLDKAKADKLRYKIEDTVVKIFITPYRTSLSPADLQFEPGDFNVDVVVALGVHNQEDVDTAITEHGRILHDATVLSINTQGGSSEDLGSIAWIDERASSLSEMISEIANQLGKEDAIDNQVATALLTGIVAETERFGNAKTSPETMQVASRLLAAGANQELVASKLAEPEQPAEPVLPLEELQNQSNDDGLNNDAMFSEPLESGNGGSDGSLEIEHQDAPSSPFAQENADFEIPQPELAEPLPEPAMPSAGVEADKPAESGSDGQAGIPPVYGPENSEAGNQQPAEEAGNTDQGEAPSFPQPPLGTEGQAAKTEPAEPAEAQQAPEPADDEPAAPAQTEEQAALDYLKDRKVETHPRALIQPLQGRRPIIEPLHHDGELPDLIEGQNPDNDKFSLTPPTLGGTLTANLPNERKATSLEKEATRHESHAPILSHSAPGGTVEPPHAAVPEPDVPLMAVLPQAPTPTLAELEEQVHSSHAKPLASQAEHHDEPVQTASLITPLIDHTANQAAAPSVSLPPPADASKPAANASTPPPVPPPMPQPASH